MKIITRFTPGLIFCLFAINSFATTVNIVASGTTFTPSNVTITVGDTVCFQGIGAFHPLVFASDSFTTYTVNPTCFVGGSPELLVGTNNFFCDVHGISFGMVGSITVMAPLVPITVDSTDFATVGDTIIIANDTLPPAGISVGGTGAQTWDFTSLQIDYFDTLRFRDINNATDDSLFPGSNLVMETPYQTSYLDFNSSSLNLLGFLGDPLGVGNDFPLNFNPPQTRMEFPSSLDSSFFDITEFVITMLGSDLDSQLIAFGLDTVRVNHHGDITSQIDAYGMVQLPSGTFNTIRQFYVESTIDSIWIYCKNAGGCTIIPDSGWSLVPGFLLALAGLPAENPITDTIYTYRWLANGEGFPVVELETDIAGGNVTVARFKIGNAVTAGIVSVTDVVLCNGDCSGQAAVNGFSGVFPYTYSWSNGDTTATTDSLCAGTYTVMVIDAVPDTAYAAVVIGEPLALSATIGTTADSGSTQGTASVSVSGGTLPYAYLWDDDSLQTTASATGLSAGPYTVTVTDTNGCTFSISDTVGFVSGINEAINAKNGIRIYPNPAVSELNVVAPLLNEGVVKIYNIIGKQLINVALEGIITKVNTSELARGLYIYQVADVKGNVLKNGKFSVLR